MRSVHGSNAEVLELVDLDVASSAAGSVNAAGGRADNFEDFYRREYPRLLVLARVLAGPFMADDVAQEAMLVVYRRWDEVRSMASPVGWARSVCMHKAVSTVRRRGVEQRILRQLGSFRSAEPEAFDQHERFWTLVRSLPRRQAQVVALHYALDLSLAEIAATLGCADGTVKAHLSRARASLAQSLGMEEEGR
jgi:RNA polymerase sigma-70 factor, ECF subfamily